MKRQSSIGLVVRSSLSRERSIHAHIKCLKCHPDGCQGRCPMGPEEGQGNHHPYPQESSDISSNPSHSDFFVYKWFRLHGSCTWSISASLKLREDAMPWKSDNAAGEECKNSNPQRMRRGQGGKLSGQIAPTPADNLAICRPGPSGEKGQA